MLSSRILVILISVALIGAVFPGFKSTLSPAGLKYVTSIGTKLILEQIQNIQIPIIEGEKVVPVVGTLGYHIHNVTIPSLTIQANDVSILAGSGFKSKLSGVSTSAHLRWEVWQKDSWPHLHDMGEAEIRLDDVTVETNISIYAASDNHPRVFLSLPRVSISDFDFTVHGKPKWFYWLLSNLFQENIKALFEDAISMNVRTTAMDYFQHICDDLIIRQEFAYFIGFDAGLVHDVLFQDKYASVYHKGEFFYPSNPTEFPDAPAPLPDYLAEEDGNLIQIIGGEYAAGSSLYALHQAYVLKYLLTPELLPSYIPFKLNSSFIEWLLIAPGLDAAYPSMPLQLFINVTETPQVQITPDGVYGFGFGEASLIVELDNGTLVTVAMANGTAYFNVIANVTAERLSIQLAYNRSEIQMMWSDVGEFHLDPVEAAMPLIMFYVTPLINQQIGQGFPLPVLEGISITNPQLKFYDHYFSVAGNLTYTPIIV